VVVVVGRFQRIEACKSLIPQSQGKLGLFVCLFVGLLVCSLHSVLYTLVTLVVGLVVGELTLSSQVGLEWWWTLSNTVILCRCKDPST
jgi:hypothetical protein